MASETDIINLALVPLLGCNRITNRNDDSTEAIVMNASYDYCRDTVLEDRAWTFATTRSVWTPTTDPIPFGNYNYSYIIPSTVLRVLTVNPSMDSYDWVRERDRILARDETINVIYTERVENTNFFSSGFINCLSLYLAWYNCIALTESRSLKDSLWAQYQDALTDAASSDGQQGKSRQTTANALLRVR